MRYKILIIVLICACGMYAQVSEGIAKNKVYQGFSGGMMLHTGYLFGQDKNAPLTPDGRSTSPQGALFGIGGALRVHLWKYLRTGFEGFVSTMPSATTDCHDLLKVWPYIGGTIGGGSMKGLYILEGDQNSWTKDANSTFHKQPFFYISPYVGCDYCLTKKVHITFRFDWMLAIHKNELLMPTGPRLYFGFMFTH